ncbi:MazG nucleotide pyrophosphohydrolase domain-containing protein [Corynebacterium endometrii]|uniref:Nucleoside triphosphate pyrophosphohydrolase n=1 Tax=Corynebacterium endometrii TaxID=2488819 RepID=A0A4P7QF07_9CORY|nr:MazG nucleotide pyrophosphohydrolase domain-containing protein [Corynebacterium endometrii]QCB28099.1 Nucleoside triphosphate pyrophosphohydrolase [Corynebacterium endometrii]
MSVVVLDPRWPDQIPLQAIGRITSPVEFGAEVPISVRWDFDAVVSGCGESTYVTTDASDPEIQARREAGERVFAAASLSDPVLKARQVMSRARDIGEWEATQTHATLLPYLEEETQEFTDAVRGGAGDEELLKELGDVFLQVLFHAEIASRRGAFDLDDVAASFVSKMRSRSPYLFDGTTTTVAQEVQQRFWAEGKAREKAGKPRGDNR